MKNTLINIYTYVTYLFLICRPDSLSLPGQSLLDVLDDIEYQMTQGSQPETLNCRVCITDDEEQKSAVIVPSKSLEGGEYDMVEEDGNVNDRGDNISESAGFDHVTKQSYDNEEGYKIIEGYVLCFHAHFNKKWNKYKAFTDISIKQINNLSHVKLICTFNFIDIIHIKRN